VTQARFGGFDETKRRVVPVLFWVVETRRKNAGL
jgi:hypothetical protein